MFGLSLLKTLAKQVLWKPQPWPDEPVFEVILIVHMPVLRAGLFKTDFEECERGAQGLHFMHHGISHRYPFVFRWCRENDRRIG